MGVQILEGEGDAGAGHLVAEEGGPWGHTERVKVD